MIEVALKFSVVVLVAWSVTRGIRPANAAAARGVWLLALASPLLFGLLTPIVFASVRPVPLLMTSAPVALPDWLPPALTMIYLAVALALLARTGAGWWRASRIVNASSPLADDDLTRVRELAGFPSMRAAESDLEGAVTAGVFSPLVLLPRDWRALPEVTLTAMLRHEAAHVRRRDPAMALAGCVVHAAFWFTPAAAIARRQCLRFAESAADASAAASMNAADYAAALLHFAAARRMRGVPMLAAGGSESSIARRVRLLLDDLEFGAQPAARVRAGLAALVIAVALFSAFRIGTASPAAAHDFDHARRHAARHGSGGSQHP